MVTKTTTPPRHHTTPPRHHTTPRSHHTPSHYTTPLFVHTEQPLPRSQGSSTYLPPDFCSMFMTHSLEKRCFLNKFTLELRWQSVTPSSVVSQRSLFLLPTKRISGECKTRLKGPFNSHSNAPAAILSSIESFNDDVIRRKALWKQSLFITYRT